MLPILFFSFDIFQVFGSLVSDHKIAPWPAGWVGSSFSRCHKYMCVGCLTLQLQIITAANCRLRMCSAYSSVVCILLHLSRDLVSTDTIMIYLCPLCSLTIKRPRRFSRSITPKDLILLRLYRSDFSADFAQKYFFQRQIQNTNCFVKYFISSNF